MEQVKDVIAVVPHQHQGALRQPAAQLHDHLPRPVGDLLVAAPLLLVVPRRRRQHREHRQGPMAFRPWDVAQPHQGDPAQPAGLDQLAPAGTHRVAVDGPRPDLGAPTPFQGLVDAEDQRAVAAIQVLEQEYQQDAGYFAGRPHGSVKHLVVAGVVALVAAAHNAQCRRHGTLTRRQDRADQQQLDFPPGWVGKQRREGNEDGYNGIGQGEHGWACRDPVNTGLPHPVCASFALPQDTSQPFLQRYNQHQVKTMTQQNITTMQDILDALDQNPDLQREFHKHVVDVIRNDDNIRQELRKEILTEELMLLPSRFTHLEEDVNQIREDVNQIRKDTTQMSGQIANLTGSDYESKAIEQSRRLIRRHLGMQRATLVYASRQDSSQFEEDVLVPAINDGRINRQQADQLEEADSIIRCQDQQGNIVCAVVEISVTVQDHDRSRAAERAEFFRRATGLRTMPFVVGQEQEEARPGTPDVPFLEYQP